MRAFLFLSLSLCDTCVANFSKTDDNSMYTCRSALILLLKEMRWQSIIAECERVVSLCLLRWFHSRLSPHTLRPNLVHLSLRFSSCKHSFYRSLVTINGYPFIWLMMNIVRGATYTVAVARVHGMAWPYKLWGTLAAHTNHFNRHNVMRFDMRLKYFTIFHTDLFIKSCTLTHTYIRFLGWQLFETVRFSSTNK